MLKMHYVTKNVTKISSWNVSYIFFDQVYSIGEENEEEDYGRKYNGHIILELSIEGYKHTFYNDLNNIYDDVLNSFQQTYKYIKNALNI